MLPQVIIIFPTASTICSQTEKENGLLSVSHEGLVGFGLDKQPGYVLVKCRLSPKEMLSEDITSGEELNRVLHFIPHVEEKCMGFQPVLQFLINRSVYR